MSTREKIIEYQLLSSIPKADLHVHFEGTARPKTIRELAASLGEELGAAFELPSGQTIPADTQFGSHVPTLRSFKDFIQYYLRVTDLIRGPEQVEIVTRDFAQSCQAQAIKHAELYFSATTFEWLKRDLGLLFEALVHAQNLARSYDLQIQWIFDIVRNTSPDGFDTVTLARKALRAGVAVTSIGLAGDERVGETSRYRNACAAAREEGFCVVAHAGEGTSAEAVRETIELLNPHRLGHALPVATDKRLQELVREKRIVLELCPWSNVLLGHVEEDSYPLRGFADSGLPFILCSDDPGIFGKSLTDNYELIARLGAEESTLRECALRSIQTVNAVTPPSLSDTDS